MNNYQVVSVRLNANRGYPIYIGNRCLYDIGSLLKSLAVGKKVAIVTNPQIEALYGNTVVSSFQNVGMDCDIIRMPPGEHLKSLSTVSTILDALLKRQFERKDTVVALGGGVVGDVAGFAASIYLRGINLIQVPTSLLAQADSAVGGKTGVNHPKGKNLIGTFYQPRFTFIDCSTIETLPIAEIRCGLAEIIKYGIIRNKMLFCYIEKHVDQIRPGNYTDAETIWQYLIWRSCINKAAVVSKDEKESNLREILNFGHTLGHGIEAVFNYEQYKHGEAVAIGMLGEAMIAHRLKMISKKKVNRIKALLVDLGFNITLLGAAPDKIIERLHLDKKVKDGKIRFVLPTTIGKVTTRDDVPISVIRSVLQDLMLSNS